jgi:hypothetical protein
MRLFVALGAMLLIVMAPGCNSGRAAALNTAAARHSTGASVAELPLPGGHKLDLWRPQAGDAFYVYIPGFDSVDYVNGNTILSRNTDSRAVRRDIYLNASDLSDHAKLTYGYPIEKLQQALDRGTPSTSPQWSDRTALWPLNSGT